jgi:peptidoglycan/xylan/chitin deacetylase (PgdA/CDA1 family)
MDKNMIRVYVFFILLAAIVFPFYNAWGFHPMTNVAASDKKDTVTHYIQKKCEPNTSNTAVFNQDKASAVIVMDDGWDSQFSIAYSILKKYGFKGNISVIPSKVDKEKYVSYQELKALYDKAGWDLLDHTLTHQNLISLSKTEKTKEILGGSKWLTNNCFTRGSKILVYPYGYFDDKTVMFLKENNFSSALTVNKTGVSENAYSKYEVPAQILSDAIDLQETKDYIDRAIALKTTAVFVLHRLSKGNNSVNDAENMFITEQHFRQIVDYLYEKRSKIEVLPYSEWLQKEGDKSVE